MITPRLKRVLFAIGWASLYFGQSAYAQFSQTQSDAPLDITSDRLESNENVAVWSGSVRVIQGDAIMTSDELVIVRNDAGELEEIQAIGDVRYSTGKEAITGEKAVYRETERSIEMTGDVVVTQGEQVMSGGRLLNWVDTGKLTFTAPEGRRVRGIFHTKSLDNQS